MSKVMKGIYFSLMVVCAVLYAVKENIGFFMIMTFCGFCILIDDNIQAKKQREELVDKATPKKHIAEHCPTCDESVRLLVTELDKTNQTLFYEVNHCCNCGQAIDWSEE